MSHNSPFSSLPSFQNKFELSYEFITKWVSPFYLNVTQPAPEWIDQYKLIKCELTPGIIRDLLGDRGWRSRVTAGFFAAIANATELIDIIGVNLLKSESIKAGINYCLALATFNTPACVDYLNSYLEYYLTQPDLFFDQRDAMEAIAYLDKQNGTNYLEKHLPAWKAFLQNKPHWQQEITTDDFESKMHIVKIVQAHKC